MMSKARKRSKASSACGQFAGAAARAIHWPQTSSSTTCPGSSRPLSRATIVPAGMPTANARSAPVRERNAICVTERCAKRATKNQSSVAAIDPQVPGPGFPNPVPKKVAAVHAQSVLLLVVILRRILIQMQAFQNFRVENWRRNAIHAACPFSQIDLPAVIAAEREILISRSHKGAACGATENLLFWLGLIAHASDL